MADKKNFEKDMKIAMKQVEEAEEKWEKWKKKVKRIMIAPDIVVRYFINPTDSVEKIIEAGKQHLIRVVVPENVLIDALNCAQEGEMSVERLLDFIQAVEIDASPWQLKEYFAIKNQDRIDHLREVALKSDKK